MSIEVSKTDLATRQAAFGSAASGSAGVATATQQAESPSEQEVGAAVRQLTAHLNAKLASPEFSVDYLSGLGVVTVKSADTGTVVFQVPDVEAVRLARLIRDGSSIGELGFMDAKA